MIKNLNRRFRVDVMDVPSTEKEIEELRNFSPIPIPEFYLEIIRQGSRLEILVDNEMYIRIWGASGCLDMNSAYNIQHYSPGPCLGIGDDEGGQAFVLASGTEEYRAGLYLVGLGCAYLEDGTYIAESLEDLLVNGTGAERIYSWCRC